MRKTLQEHLERIKELSKINENTSSEFEFAEMFNDPNTVNTLGDGIGVLLKDISDELDNLGREVGDKDGKIEIVGDDNQVIESILNLNEAAFIMSVGTALAAPKIIEILGKGVQQLGIKTNTDVIRNAGTSLSKAGHKMHHLYANTIVSSLKRLPQYKDSTDEQLEHIANGIILGATVAFGIASMSGAVGALKAGKAGLAAIESGLTGVKGAEIAKLGKSFLPRILNGFAK